MATTTNQKGLRYAREEDDDVYEESTIKAMRGRGRGRTTKAAAPPLFSESPVKARRDLYVLVKTVV